MAKGMVTLEADRCKGCGLCVEVCPAFILKLSEEDFNKKGYRPIEVTDMDKCTGCRLCEWLCPDWAHVAGRVLVLQRAHRGVPIDEEHRDVALIALAVPGRRLRELLVECSFLSQRGVFARCVR